MTRYKQNFPDPFLKSPASAGIPRFGHLNALADRVTAIEQGTSVLTGPLIFEGTTANAYELTVSPGDPTADRTITFPDLTGTVLVTTGAQTVSGVKTFSGGIATTAITEGTAGAGISMDKPIIRKAGTAKAVNTTGSITAAELAGGLITSTSASTVTATLPTATLLATQLGAVQGTIFEFVVDNTAGANTVTVAVNTGIVVCSGVVTGSNTLTVAASATTGIGVFRLVFSSATAAVLYRLG